MDYSLYRDINGLSGSSFADGIFKFVSVDFVVLLVVAVALLFLVPWRTHRIDRRAGAVTATASAALALLIAQPISHAVDRLRPYVSHPGHAHLLIARSHDASFPSDHATGSMALAVGILVYDRVAGLVMLALAVLVAFARVYTGTHYPGDVLAGAVLGAVVALVLGRTPIARLLQAFTRRASALWDGALGAVIGRRRVAPGA
jgi:membrane-associated phospholipid phosphatase